MACGAIALSVNGFEVAVALLKPSLPPQLAALIQTNVNVQALTVEAALQHKRQHVYHAAMLDPHTAAELSLAQIVAMVDELLEAHGNLIPTLE